ncbi:MAG: SAM-dependent methyltransferase, partial [Aureispira sp.]
MGNLKRFWKYYWQAETKHTVRAPFVSELIEQVIEDDRRYYDFGALQRLRTLCEQNQTVLSVQDFGAGS